LGRGARFANECDRKLPANLDSLHEERRGLASPSRAVATARVSRHLPVEHLVAAALCPGIGRAPPRDRGKALRPF